MVVEQNDDDAPEELLNFDLYMYLNATESVVYFFVHDAHIHWTAGFLVVEMVECEKLGDNMHGDDFDYDHKAVIGAAENDYMRSLYLLVAAAVDDELHWCDRKEEEYVCLWDTDWGSCQLGFDFDVAVRDDIEFDGVEVVDATDDEEVHVNPAADVAASAAHHKHLFPSQIDSAERQGYRRRLVEEKEAHHHSEAYLGQSTPNSLHTHNYCLLRCSYFTVLSQLLTTPVLDVNFLYNRICLLLYVHMTQHPSAASSR